MSQSVWYKELIKPSWAPPADWFGPVWSVLYTIIFFTFGYVFYKVLKGEYPKKVALPFVLNLIFNLLFTPIQFGLQNNVLALIDIILVLVTLLWALKVILPHQKAIAYLNVPYALWVTFATMLQVTITIINF